MWGISSAGRAPALHAGGQEFESPILHHYKKDLENRSFFIANNFKISSKYDEVYIIMELMGNLLERYLYKHLTVLLNSLKNSKVFFDFVFT